LIKNFLISQLILTFGLSYVFLELFFHCLQLIGINNNIAVCAIYSIVFLVFPVFKMAQTIPLVTHYFSRTLARKTTANILFFSTLGSFLGSIFTTLILMQYFGVNYAVIITLTFFLVLIIFIWKQRYYYDLAVSVLLLALAIILNSSYMMKSISMVASNQYHNVAVITLPEIDGKLLSLNRSASSMYTPNKNHNFSYINYIEDHYIKHASNKKILVIGAGGFTLGYQDSGNEYDYIDIDNSLKDIAEKYILPAPLKANKRFISDSAMRYLKNNNVTYDLIVVDAYSNIYSVPLEVTVYEFWLLIKQHLNRNGIVVANIITSPSFADKFAVRFDNTFHLVFKNYNRQIIGEFNGWNNEMAANIIYSYYNNDYSLDNTIYKLNKTSFSKDHPRK
jgi:predicted membrane-bound spermidine synthase